MAVKRYANSSTGAGSHVFVITPHATNAISPIPRQIRFNAAGAVVLRAIDSAADVTINVVAGEVLDWQVQFIRVAGTTVAANTIHGVA